MKRNSIPIFIMVLILASLCSAQSNKVNPEHNGNSPVDKQSAERSILSNEKQAWDAIVKSNSTAFRSFHTNDALIVSPEGVARIDQFASQIPSLNIMEYGLSDVKVMWIDDNTAILIYEVMVKVLLADQNVSISNHYHSSTWVNRGGKWLSIFHQVSVKSTTQ